MKYADKIGFWQEDAETSPGIWGPSIVEKPYIGDILKSSRRFQESEGFQNGELFITNRVSILADMYLQNNLQSIKYICWKGGKWKVTSIDVDYPRIILEIGGPYHE